VDDPCDPRFISRKAWRRKDEAMKKSQRASSHRKSLPKKNVANTKSVSVKAPDRRSKTSCFLSGGIKHGTTCEEKFALLSL
jgi:hypothetical protein